MTVAYAPKRDDSTGTWRFYVTGPFARTDEWHTAKLIRSAHAKEVGTGRTVCGLPTSTWVTRFDAPFTAARMSGACPACRERVAVVTGGQ